MGTQILNSFNNKRGSYCSLNLDHQVLPEIRCTTMCG